MRPPTTYKEKLEVLRTVAGCASRAAMASGFAREFEELKTIIEKQEKHHRRFVGKGKRRFTIAQARDYFIVSILGWGIGKSGHGWERQWSALVGLREDFVRGAVLIASEKFRKAFDEELRGAWGIGGVACFRNVWWLSDTLDYCDFIGEGVT